MRSQQQPQRDCALATSGRALEKDQRVSANPQRSYITNSGRSPAHCIVSARLRERHCSIHGSTSSLSEFASRPKTTRTRPRAPTLLSRACGACRRALRDVSRAKDHDANARASSLAAGARSAPRAPSIIPAACTSRKHACAALSQQTCADRHARAHARSFVSRACGARRRRLSISRELGNSTRTRAGARSPRARSIISSDRTSRAEPS